MSIVRNMYTYDVFVFWGPILFSQGTTINVDPVVGLTVITQSGDLELGIHCDFWLPYMYTRCETTVPVSSTGRGQGFPLSLFFFSSSFSFWFVCLWNRGDCTLLFQGPQNRIGKSYTLWTLDPYRGSRQKVRKTLCVRIPLCRRVVEPLVPL